MDQNLSKIYIVLKLESDFCRHIQIGLISMFKFASSKRATLDQYMLYKHSVKLCKFYNHKKPIFDWLTINFMQTVVTSRQTTLFAVKSNKLCVGNNLLCNQLSILNGEIKLDMLNLSFHSYKVACKKLFLLNLDVIGL